jgi:hypothetical protein
MLGTSDHVRRPLSPPHPIDLFSYYAKVLEADPEFVQNANNVVEYEMSNGKVFKGFYKTRGPYEV